MEEKVINHILQGLDPQIIDRDYKSFQNHVSSLEEIKSRLFIRSRTSFPSDPVFGELLKDSFRLKNDFKKRFVFKQTSLISQQKMNYPLSYFYPKIDSQLKFGKTKLNGCIDPVHGYPCGKCLYCLEQRRLPWTIRLTHERKFWSHLGIPTFFVTLTYDEDNLPQEGVNKRDIQLFLKKLRKHYNSLEDNKLKYFCVSEYGPTTLRAHYHLILFGLNRNLSSVLRIISDCWNKGFIKVSKVKPSRIRYVTKYSTKFFDKLTDEQREILHNKNLEFRLMSKGLGLSFLTQQNIDYYKKNPDNLTLVLDDMRYYLPRYYRDKIFDKYDRKFKFKCFEESLKKHLDFISYYYNHIYIYDLARSLNGSPSVFREHYDRDVQRYIDFTKKNAKI